MSRRLPILIAICFLATFTTGAFAADESVRSEIVYRASFGRADDIKLLVAQGASPDQVNGNGTPILAVAAVRTDPEAANVIGALLDLGAHINASDPKGQNALFYAAKSGNVEIVNLLLERKIDLQAVDANGNNARAEAAAAGHQNIIDAMDAFVKKQALEKNTAVKQQQELKADEAQKATAASQAKALVAITDKQSKKIAEDKIKDASQSLEKTPEAVADGEPFAIDEKKLEQANAPVAEEAPPTETFTPEQQRRFDSIIKHGLEKPAEETTKAPPAPPVKTPDDLAAEKAARDAAEQKRKQDIKNMAYDVAYHTCAFQYWVYVLQVRQSTELGSEELTIAIQTQKDAAEAPEKKMISEYHLPPSFYANITNSAQLRIYDQLNSMASNRVRHENNVGKMDDMENRCEEIARQWGFPASYKANPSAVPNDGKSSNGKPSRPVGHR